jgi:hypothetical protein
MSKKIIIWLGVLLLVVACGVTELSPTAVPESPIEPTRIFELPVTEVPACIPPEPSEEDLNRVLAFTGGRFDRGDWQRSEFLYEDKVAVSWISDSLSAVAYLEALIFPCGYEEPDLDDYFSEETWEVIFESYESYDQIADCSNAHGERLYEWEVVSNGTDYDIRYWVKNDTDYRVLAFMLVLPPEGENVMNDYAYALFPQLQSCP